MNPAAILLLVGSAVLGGAALWWSITMSMAIDAPMSAGGWGAMIAGIVVTLLLGIGLMSLLFSAAAAAMTSRPIKRKAAARTASRRQTANRSAMSRDAFHRRSPLCDPLAIVSPNS